jgi:hypothetical protein
MTVPSRRNCPASAFDHDRERARAILVTGIVASVAWIVLYSVLVPVPRT